MTNKKKQTNTSKCNKASFLKQYKKQQIKEGTRLQALGKKLFGKGFLEVYYSGQQLTWVWELKNGYIIENDVLEKVLKFVVFDAITTSKEGLLNIAFFEKGK